MFSNNNPCNNFSFNYRTSTVRIYVARLWHPVSSCGPLLCISHLSYTHVQTDATWFILAISCQNCYPFGTALFHGIADRRVGIWGLVKGPESHWHDEEDLWTLDTSLYGLPLMCKVETLWKEKVSTNHFTFCQWQSVIFNMVDEGLLWLIGSSSPTLVLFST